jgi:hypothetical protein
MEANTMTGVAPILMPLEPCRRNQKLMQSGRRDMVETLRDMILKAGVLTGIDSRKPGHGSTTRIRKSITQLNAL